MKSESEILDNIKTVEKPWGRFRQYVLNGMCTVKLHTIRKGECTSLQSHRKRSELFIVLDGRITVQKGSQRIRAKPGQEIFIPVEERHRIESAADGARIVEISFGHFDEADITRYEDRYGRKGL